MNFEDIELGAMMQIILVAYVNIDGKSLTQSKSLVEEFRLNVINPILEKDESIKCFVVPVKDSNTRIECIYPVKQ